MTYKNPVKEVVAENIKELPISPTIDLQASKSCLSGVGILVFDPSTAIDSTTRASSAFGLQTMVHGAQAGIDPSLSAAAGLPRRWMKLPKCALRVGC